MAPSHGTKTRKRVHSAFAQPLSSWSRKMSLKMAMINQIHASRSMNQNIETMTSQSPKPSDMSSLL
jgi:hypothetical protein